MRHGAGLDPGFDAPAGVALVDGELLVANQGSAGATSWSVVGLAVADRPAPDPASTGRSTTAATLDRTDLTSIARRLVAGLGF